MSALALIVLFALLALFIAVKVLKFTFKVALIGVLVIAALAAAGMLGIGRA